MACSWLATLGTGGTGVRRSITSGAALVTSNFDYTIPNSYEIRRVKLKNLTNSTGFTAASRTFKYVILENVGVLTLIVRHISPSFVHTGATDTEEIFTLSPYYTVPASGTFYNGFLYTNTSASSGNFFSSTNPPDSSLTDSVILYRDFPSSVPVVGSTLVFESTGEITNNWLLMTEEACSPLISLTAADLTSRAFISLPSLASYKVLSALGVAMTPVADAPVQTSKTLITSASLSHTPAIADSAVIRSGTTQASNSASSATIGVPTLTRTVLLSTASLNQAPTSASALINKSISLSASSISMTPKVEASLAYSLANLRLSSKSSRTPDAGINLDWEESGVPKAYSWYNKVLYKFHLDFDQITEEECLWLEAYCDLYRYKEIDYQWPFDSHVYRCILTSDPAQTIIRSDTSLGVVCTAFVELIGYEIA